MTRQFRVRAVRPVLFFLWALTGCALAQAPIEERVPAVDPLLQAQQKASAAYRDLEQARYASKLAEQDFLNAEMAYKAAEKPSAALKQNLDAARKNLDAARAKESAVQRAYERAIEAAKPPK